MENKHKDGPVGHNKYLLHSSKHLSLKGSPLQFKLIVKHYGTLKLPMQLPIDHSVMVIYIGFINIICPL